MIPVIVNSNALPVIDATYLFTFLKCDTLLISETRSSRMNVPLTFNHSSNRQIIQINRSKDLDDTAPHPFFDLSSWRSSGSFLSPNHRLFVFLSFCLFVFLSFCFSSSSFILVHLSSLKFVWKPSESSFLSFQILSCCLSVIALCLSVLVFIFNLFKFIGGRPVITSGLKVHSEALWQMG